MLDYKKLIEISMLDMIKGILKGIAKDGLPGNHHFYITFDTNNSNVKIPQWMLEKYPEKMTIIIRNWFDNLKVSSNYFEITLNFSNQPERLTVPFDSIELFADPSVDFALSFNPKPNEISKQEKNIKIQKRTKESSKKENQNIVDFNKFKK
jgi:Uncharacterized protein conserved in bacteria|tara:strand:- start:448 stop:900 length:453 start_codon:yes stop_codon:yes gene_type:complete